MKKPWYTIISGATKKQAEILIYEEIGENFFGEGVSAKQFVKDLQALGALEQITLRINSPGGNVFDGFAIYNALVRNPARVIAEIDGMAASAASVVALAGNVVHMASNASFMIHDAWGVVMGTGAAMRKMADVLDKIGDNIADVYVNKSNKKPEQVRAWMAEETWFSADEAKDAGFIDEITNSFAIAACFDLSRYRKVPRNILALRSTTRDTYQPKLLRLAQVAAQQRRKGVTI